MSPTVRVLLPAALILVAFLAFACGTQLGGPPGAPGQAPGLSRPARSAQAEATPLPTFLPGQDELWIFAEGPRGEAKPAKQEGPGGGSMVARSPAGTVLEVPLRHTDVQANVRGYLATVDLRQQFHNPYAEKIEAIYVFPLPDDAAVREFVLVIGDRQIRGIVREKEEARRIYHAARAQGHRAALLDQARPNVFEQAIANIEPGKSIDVMLRYFHTLAYGQDGYEFVFPMVVGPRYNPTAWQQDAFGGDGSPAPASLGQQGIGAVPAGSPPGTSGQPTEVAYLPPEVQTASALSLTVDVDAGLALQSVSSPSHEIAVESPAPSRAKVKLAGGTTIPNRDFVLRLLPAGNGCSTTLLTHTDASGGYLTMLVHPPAELGDLPRRPMELIFVVDCSGSMKGAPLGQCQAAVEMALQQLGPADTFQLIRFGDTADCMAPAPLAATPANVARGLAHVRALQANGGTEMVSGMRAALDGARDAEKVRFVVFLTDGYIGNERDVFDVVRNNLRGARVFSLGVGSSVNRYLLEGMARLGRGAVGYLLHDEAPGRAVAQLFHRIGHPALTDLQVDWGGATVSEQFPRQLPDLFAGRPVVLTARFHGSAPANVRLRGRVGGGVVELPVPQRASTEDDATAALPAVWARRKIQSLSDYAEIEGHEGAPAEVRQLALTYGLVSAFTSYVAVDASERTAGDYGVTVQVPVPMPAGVRYDTTVSGK